MKTFYADYARHMWRFYFKLKNELRTETDKLNHEAAERAVERLNVSERNILSDVYSFKGDINNRVQAVAESHSIDANEVWQTLNFAEKLIAKERGLI